MSFAAEFARLSAVEALRPTMAMLEGRALPTLARHRVFDSRNPQPDDLIREGDQPYTPTLSVFTRRSVTDRRGAGQGSVSRFARTTIEIVAELSVELHEEDQPFVDAMVATDPAAHLVLAAMCGQVRYVLTQGETGAIFRQAVMSIESIDEQAFAVPELGLRYQRTLMLLECMIPDDVFSPDGGLPQPVARLAPLLPAQSYAAETLARLTEQFGQSTVLPKLDTLAFVSQPAGASGQFGPAGSVTPPFAPIEE